MRPRGPDATDGPQEGPVKGSGRHCKRCGQPGHYAKTCPNTHADEKPAGVGRGKGQRTCKKCGQPGHFAKTCKNVTQVERGPGGRGRHTGQRVVCKKCGEVGHYAKTCGKAKSVKGSSSKRRCKKCGELGHFAKTCAKHPGGL